MEETIVRDESLVKQAEEMMEKQDSESAGWPAWPSGSPS